MSSNQFLASLVLKPISPEFDRSKLGWTVKVNGEVVSNVNSVEILHPKFGALTYGMSPQGFDTWGWREPGGGGSAVVPYAFCKGELLIGLALQRRPNQGGNVLNLPRGFLDPGESHFEAAKREFEEEIGMDPSKLRFKRLLGEPKNPNSTFFETPGDGDGVKFFAIHFHSKSLEPASDGGGMVFRKDSLKVSSAVKQAKLDEDILGSRFLPYEQAVSVADMFTSAGIALLIAQERLLKVK